MKYRNLGQNFALRSCLPYTSQGEELAGSLLLVFQELFHKWGSHGTSGPYIPLPQRTGWPPGAESFVGAANALVAPWEQHSLIYALPLLQLFSHLECGIEMESNVVILLFLDWAGNLYCDLPDYERAAP